LRSTQQYDLIMLGVIVISQLVDITSLICCCYSFSASRIGDESLQDEQYAASLLEGRCKAIMRYFQLISCNIFGGSNVDEGLNTVARVLTNFFHHDGFLDVVPSDVVAGIMLVRIQQRQRRRQLLSQTMNPLSQSDFEGPLKYVDIEEARDCEEIRTAFISNNNVMSPFAVSDRRTLDKRNEADRVLIEVAAKYAVYMIAIYTHLLALYMQPCTGLCCLCYSKMKNGSEETRGGEEPSSCSRLLCCSLCGRRNTGTSSYSRFQSASSHPFTVKGDNSCRANHAGLVHFTKDIQSEVVYASYENDTVAKPFAIFLNHDQRSVVVTIRGSMSLEDCITDAIADPVELKEAGERWGFNGVGRYAHGGFLSAALNIREEIESSQVLQRTFEPANPPVHGTNDSDEGPAARIIAIVSDNPKYCISDLMCLT
jgi:sn1-specific diacylglycerol lipase